MLYYITQCCNDYFIGPVNIDVQDISIWKNYTGLLIEWAEPLTHPPTFVSYYIVAISNHSFNTTSNSTFIPYDSVGTNIEVIITIVAYNLAGGGNASIVTANTSVCKYNI